MKTKLYARWGVLLGRILEETGGKKKDLHRALVRAKGMNSLTNLTTDELRDLIEEIVAHMASEYGIEIYFDRNNLENMTLTELFEYYESKNKRL